ncbi:MAG: BACON domain-containing carbohydrate-binding protein, partial [Bacteroidota bacterium]
MKKTLTLLAILCGFLSLSAQDQLAPKNVQFLNGLTQNPNYKVQKNLRALPAHLSQGACGTEVNDSSESFMQDMQEKYLDFASNFKLMDIRAEEEIVYLAMQFYVVRQDDGTGGALGVDVQTALDNVNDIYLGAGIQFFPDETIQYINASEYFNFDANEEEDLLDIAYKANTINVYIVDSLTANGRELCGYSYYPNSDKPDIVVLDKDCLNLSTFPHELGHFFGLYHTHGPSNCGNTTEWVDGRNCSNAGDLVCDTPADPNLLRRCQTSLVIDCKYVGTARDPFGRNYAPLTDNLMSYAPHQCRKNFTEGQYARIRFFYENGREYIRTLQIAAFAVDPDTLFFDQQGSTQSVNVTASDFWIVTGSVDWVFASTSIGIGTRSVTISCAPNTSSGTRSTSITISGVEGAEDVVIIQEGAEVNLSVDPDTLILTATLAADSFAINTNTAWTTSTNVDWLSLDQTEGAGDAIVNVTALENIFTQTRQGDIYVTTGEILDTVTVIQIGASPVLALNTDTLRVGPAATEELVNITSNTDWEAFALDNWVMVSPASGSGDEVLTLSIGENQELSSRITYVYVTIGEDVDTVWVYQEGRSLITLQVDPDVIELDELGQTTAVTISSNGNWTVTASDDWLTLNQNIGNGDANLTLTVEENTSGSDRMGQLFFETIDQVDTLTIFQSTQQLNFPNGELQLTPFAGTILGKIKIGTGYAEEGDLLAAYDETGVLCGFSSVIIEEGIAYMAMTIYGDDPNTEVDEGVGSDEGFTLELLDVSDAIIYLYGGDFNPFLFSWQNSNGAPMPPYNDINTVFNFLNEPVLDLVELKAGWNLISIDVEPEDSSVAALMSSLLPGNLEIVTGFEEEAIFYDPNGPEELNTLTHFRKGSAYWVKVIEEDFIFAFGPAIDESYRKPLRIGWNLVGYPPIDPQGVSDYFADLLADGSLQYVTGYDEGTTFFDPNGPDFLNSLQQLSNGYGYWVDWNPGEKALAVKNNQFMFVGGETPKDMKENSWFLSLEDGTIIGEIQRYNIYLKTSPIYADNPQTERVEGPKIGQKVGLINSKGIKVGEFDFVGDYNIHRVKWMGEMKEELNLTIFPNPARARVQVRFGAKENTMYQLELINHLGQTIRSQSEKVQSGASLQTHFDVQGLSRGKIEEHT